MNIDICDHHDVKFLGTLGTVDHYRCRDCGLEFSEHCREGYDDEDEDDDADFREIDCDDSDDGYVLASAGFGTDEDYGYYGHMLDCDELC